MATTIKKSAFCPLDFDLYIDAYNYAMWHKNDKQPLAVKIPFKRIELLNSLAANGVKLFAVWVNDFDEAATEYAYTTKAAAHEILNQLEEGDKDAGVYEPNYYSVIDFTKYCL